MSMARPTGFALLFLACLQACLASAISTTPLDIQDAASILFSARAPAGDCLSIQELPTAGLELSEDEEALLQYICIPPTEALGVAADPPAVRRAIPPGVNCTEVEWCDEGKQCSIVCARGSVVIEEWQAHATRAQLEAQADIPLCRASFLGTHNSAISIADGYGNLDEYWEGYFRYIKWAVPKGHTSLLRTNNQWLSLTDQLNMGVRIVELDTHWVGGDMRIAHCGGLHVPQLNALIGALNLVAKLLRRHIRWDTESVGCSPSLSSIPVLEQRTLGDALTEVAAWMKAKSNADQVVVLFFDDQSDLAKWGLVQRLLQDVTDALPRGWIYTPDDHASWMNASAGSAVTGLAASVAATSPGVWPTARQLVAAGKRLVLVSGADYGAAMAPLAFAKDSGAVCGWSEPRHDAVHGLPHCEVAAPGGTAAPRPIWDGTWTRLFACELQYGPLDCDFHWGGAPTVVSAADMASLTGCGLGLPAPDLLTPARAAGALWGWAPDQPAPQPPLSAGPGVRGWVGAVLRVVWNVLGFARVQYQYRQASCAVIEASSGRWASQPCAQDLHNACRGAGDGTAGNATLAEIAPWWAAGSWVVAPGARGECPPGTRPDAPRHGVDNRRLAAAVVDAGQDMAWLPLQGGSHAWNMATLPTW